MLSVTFDKVTDELTIANTGTEATKTPPKIFIKPSEDLGIDKNIRKFSPERDYLDVLRYRLVSITVEGRSYTLGFDTGANYSNGIYLKTTDEAGARPLSPNGSVTVSITLDKTTLDRDYRFKFEVV